MVKLYPDASLVAGTESKCWSVDKFASVEGSRKILCTLMNGVGEGGQHSSFKATNATLATLLTLKMNVFFFIVFFLLDLRGPVLWRLQRHYRMKTGVKCVHQTFTRLQRAFIEHGSIESVDRFSAGSVACNKPVAAEGTWSSCFFLSSRRNSAFPQENEKLRASINC